MKFLNLIFALTCLFSLIASKNQLLKKNRILEITKTKSDNNLKDRKLFLENAKKTEEIFKLEKEMEEMDEEIEQNKSKLIRGF